MKNRDRDEKHRRRRQAGDRRELPDGMAMAEALYGGPAPSDTDPETDGAPEQKEGQ